MKITPNFTQLKNNIKAIKAQRLENKIQKFVNIADVKNVDTYNTLLPARKGIAEYAKANKVKVFIYNASKDEPNQLHVAVTKKNNELATFVMDRYEGSQYIKSRDINGNPKVVETVERKRTRFLEDKDGLNYKAVCKEQRDETFLRR